ncbi:MAG: glycosyltransferase family 39 protein, partial [Deltaproteobacteria bacterium]|nr:glycosyltransferase family 39 protein [Deltaproteobacteria bacterium]
AMIYIKNIRAIAGRHYVGIIMSVIIVTAIFFMSPPRFKILNDEGTLIGISMMMHENKISSAPVQGYYYGDSANLRRELNVNKRPLLFPFFFLFVHSAFGYSAYHGFVVNYLCGILILILSYVFISKTFSRSYAAIAVLIFSGCPIFVLWITASGFETVNLLFIILTFLFFHKFLQEKNIDNAELLILTLILLAQCRYESLLFMVTILFLLPWLAGRKHAFQFSCAMYVVPVLLIPTLWQRRLYNKSVVDLIVEIGPNQFEIPQQLFSAGNFLANIPKNIFVFTGLNPSLGFTPVLFILSFAGVYMLARKKLTDPTEISSKFNDILPFGITTFILMSGIISSYYWGDFQLPLSNRFAIAFLPYMVFSAIFCLDSIERKTKKPLKIFLITFFIFHLLFYWPYGAHQKNLKSLPLPKEYQKVLSYLETEYKDSQNTLIICERPNLYVIHQYGAVSFTYANSHINEIMIAMSRYYDHIVVLQSYNQKECTVMNGSLLHGAYKVQEKQKINVSMSSYVRVSEVIK